MTDRRPEKQTILLIIKNTLAAGDYSVHASRMPCNDYEHNRKWPEHILVSILEIYWSSHMLVATFFAMQ